MGRLTYTTDDLVVGVRSLLDESNQDSVDTVTDILPSLNRALQYGMDILARKYPEPLLKHSTLVLVAGQAEYSIPEDCFEDRLLKVEIAIPGGGGATYRKVERISYRDISDYESSITTNLPIYYCVIGRNIRLLSTPSGTYSARVWYLTEPEQLVLPQGRLTHIGSNLQYVVLDTAGESLSTESDQLASYVNLINGQTGQVRATLQISSVVEDKITFRTVPLRTSVLGRTVTGVLPLDTRQDDYLCSVVGSCIPAPASPLGNFLIEYCVAEMTGKLGGDRTTEEQILDKFEKQLERIWVGRERQMRVQKKSEKWGTPVRRWWYE